MGKLVMNVGGMFSGKTTELLRVGKRHKLAGHKVICLKPDFDIRYSEDKVVSHDGQIFEAININPASSILWHSGMIFTVVDVILIDEIQFFEESIIDFIELQLDLGKTIYVSGLDMDFQGNGFSVVEKLMAKADEVNKFHAVCVRCGADAVFSLRKDSENKELVSLGSEESYMAVCRNCRKELKGRGNSVG